MSAGDWPPTAAHRLRRMLAFVALLAIVPVLSACGGSEDSASVPGFKNGTLSAKDLALVADRTTAKGGMRVAVAQRMSLGDQGTLAATGSGSFDSRTRRGEMTLSMDLSNLTGGDALGGGKTVQHMIFDGFTFYMRSSAFDGALPAGKRWLKLDLAKAGKELGIDFASLTQGAGQDPTQTLQYLKAAAGDVTRVDTETVRGEPTTHYKATVELAKVADSAPANQRAAMRRSLQQIIELSGTKKVPIEVWVDDDGIARRTVSSYGSNIAGQRTTITQRTELFDFGTNVGVKIPSDDDTVDFSELGGLLQGAGRATGDFG